MSEATIYIKKHLKKQNSLSLGGGCRLPMGGVFSPVGGGRGCKNNNVGRNRQERSRRTSLTLYN